MMCQRMRSRGGLLTPLFLCTAGEIVERASHIFDDAGEAYSSLPAIAKRLEAWKSRYLQAYNDAFVSICLPKLFAPYVRLQMLAWDPLAVCLGAMWPIGGICLCRHAKLCPIRLSGLTCAIRW